MGSSPVAVASQGGAALQERVEEKKTYRRQITGMPGSWLNLCSCLALNLHWASVDGQHLGAGGLPGQRTPRTGAVWPPYEGAGQGYWARQAGFSLPFQQQQQTYQPAQTMEQIQNTLQQQQLYTPQMVSGQTYWVPRQQQQQLYTEQQQQ